MYYVYFIYKGRVILVHMPPKTGSYGKGNIKDKKKSKYIKLAYKIAVGEVEHYQVLPCPSNLMRFEKKPKKKGAKGS